MKPASAPRTMLLSTQNFPTCNTKKAPHFTISQKFEKKCRKCEAGDSKKEYFEM